MPKVFKKRVCICCEAEKVAKDDFTGAAKTCKACLGAGRVCDCCRRPSQRFGPGKARCKDCNSRKETAEHVDVCRGQGCLQQFDDALFEWRGTSWRSTCRTCNNKPKHKATAADPDRRCTRCTQLKPAEGFHGNECKDCRSSREREHRKALCDAADPSITPGKACTKCNAPFSAPAFTWQGDRWSSWCRTCFNNAHYHAAWRERKLEEDAAGFREHNNAVLCQYRTTHSANVAQYQLRQKTDVEPLWQRWKRQAADRDISIDMEEEEELKSLFLLECHYCGYLPAPGHPLNTLDRVDNTIRRYSLQTCVPCCVPCNWLKGSKSKPQFLEEAFETASAGKCDGPEDRRAVDKSFRSMGLRGKTNKPAPYTRMQLRLVAEFNGYTS